MSLGYNIRDALPSGPDAIGDYERARRERQQRWDETATRIWRESLPAFEAAVAARGYAGWDPELFLTYRRDGYPVAQFTEHGLAQGGGQWLPREPYDGPSAERLAQQFERWELVEAAEALGLTEDAKTLRQPCPEKGFERRRWTLAAELVQARREAEAEARREAAAIAAAHPFAALAALKK